jgi:pimeloyl-ACP methyl ester carboxylesterase
MEDELMPNPQVWAANERAGLQASGQYIERLIPRPLNPDSEREGYFDLYYYINRSTGAFPGLKTVLFCTGGPGQIVRPGEESFLDFLANEFDRFLRTSHAVEDIESIRVAVLKDEPWDGIVGYSYGTVLAQRYVGTKKYWKNVRKLILIGPVSMHKFTQPSTAGKAFDQYVKAVQEIRHEVLEKIIAENDEFKNALPLPEVKGIERKLDETYDKIENTFGSEKFIADHYDSLQGLLERDSKLAGLPRLFFEKLRDIRSFGWNPIDIKGVRSRQLEAVKVIAVSLRPELKLELGEIEPSGSFPYNPDYGAYRAFYVFRINDGLDRKYLKEFCLAGREESIRELLNRSAGTAGVNQFYKKIGNLDLVPEIWDPADHKHGVDTLILKGKADPVSADGQAEHYFDKALTGNKTLIEFDGVGHSFDFPFISIRNPFMIGSVRIDPGKFEPGETKTATGAIPRLARIVETDDDKIRAVRRIGTDRRREPVFDFRDVIIESENKLVVQVINLSGKAESTKGIKLAVRHLLFSGLATLDPHIIPDGVESWISGTFEMDKGSRKFSVEPPGLEPGLTFEPDSERLILPDKLTVIIKNRSSKVVFGSPKNWVYRPRTGVKFEGPCQGPELYARDCIIYAFLEMEYDSFRQKKSEILERVKRAESFPGKIHVREGP